MRWNHLTRKQQYKFKMITGEILTAVLHEMYEDGTLKVCEEMDEGKATYLNLMHIVMVRGKG